MDYKALLAAYRVIREQEIKQKRLDKMSASDPNYSIIKELINSAQHGVIITVTFKDGSKMDIKRQDEFDKLNNRYQEAF